MKRKVDFYQNVVKLFVLSIVVFKVILLILTLSRFCYTKQSHSLSSCELILTGLLKLNHSNQLPYLCLLWLSVIRSVILTLVQCPFLVKHSFFKAFCQSQQTSSCIPHSSSLRGADAFFGSCFVTRRENSYKLSARRFLEDLWESIQKACALIRLIPPTFSKSRHPKRSTVLASLACDRYSSH